MINKGTIQGYSAIWLENDFLKISILPEKGADFYEFVYKPENIDFLLKSPTGLKVPVPEKQTAFVENYEGGWQELFPNANEACNYRGIQIPTHGEVALQRWEVEILEDTAHQSVIQLSVRCNTAPYILQRTLTLKQGDLSLEIAGKIINTSPESQYCVWGHHVVLGGDFLEKGCMIKANPSTLITPDELFEETARLLPGQVSAWHMAESRIAGEKVDLRLVPGPEQHSHDDVFITGFQDGKVEVINPEKQIGFRLDWDTEIFKYMVLWQPYGGADLPPLTGIYGLGIEPWVSRFPLEEAIRQNEALKISGHGTLTTKLIASITTNKG